MDFGTVAQTVQPVRHHRLPRADPLQNLGMQAGNFTCFHRHHFHRIVRAYCVNKLAFFACLNRRSRHQYRIGNRAQIEFDIHKLVGKQHLIAVIKRSFQIQGAGSGVDLVVDGKQLAFGQLLAVVTIPRFGF